MRMSLKAVFQCIAMAILGIAGSLTAFANQSVIVDCRQGGQPVVTSGLTSTTKVLQSFPSCTITVSIHGGGAATIFSDNSGTPLANPFTAQNNPYPGAGFFYAANGRYDITISGGGITSPLTFSDILLNDPATLTGCSQLPALTGDVTSAGGTCATVLPNIATPGTGLKTTINAKGQVTSNTSAASTDLSDTALIARLNAAANFGLNPITAGNITGLAGVFTTVSNNGETVAGEVSPDVTGRQLGDVTHRWDAFIRNLDVAGTITGAITGNGTSGSIPKFTGTSTVGNSSITDNGTTVSTSEVMASLGLNINSTGLLSTTAQSGTGSLCMTTNCVMVTPNIGVASGTSLALTTGLTQDTVVARTRDCRVDGTIDLTGTIDSSGIINTCIANARTNKQTHILLPCGTLLWTANSINGTNFPGIHISGCGAEGTGSAPTQSQGITAIVCNQGTTKVCIDFTGSGNHEIDHMTINIARGVQGAGIGILQGRDNGGAGGGSANPLCYNQFWNIHDIYITDNGGTNPALNSGRGFTAIYNVGAENGVYNNVATVADTPILLSQTNILGISSPFQTLQTGCPLSMTGVTFISPILTSSANTLPVIEANLTEGIRIFGIQGVGGSALIKFENSLGASPTDSWMVTGQYEQGISDIITTSVSLDNMDFHVLIAVPPPGFDIKMGANSLTLSQSTWFFDSTPAIIPFIDNASTGTLITGSQINIGGATSASNTTVTSSTIYAPSLTDAQITFNAASNYDRYTSSGISTVGTRKSGSFIATSNGSVTAPALGVTSNSGLFALGSGIPQIASNGVVGPFFSSTQLGIGSSSDIISANNPDPSGSAPDANIGRIGPGIWGFGTGAHGSTAGTVQAAVGNFTNHTGTATNNNATAGSFGEVISSTIATGSSVSLSTGTTANITSISLTAGDWDCTGAVDFTFGATTSYTNLVGSISTTSATLGAQDSKFDFETPAAVPTATADMTFPLPVVRESLAGTTTVFLVAQGTFSVSTLKAYGTIRCRRMR